METMEIYSGQKFNFSLIAVDQTRTFVSTEITTKTSSTARLNLDQSTQMLPGACSNLSYNLYSTKTFEQLILYPDGPCRDTGLARAIINVMSRWI